MHDWPLYDKDPFVHVAVVPPVYPNGPVNVPGADDPLAKAAIVNEQTPKGCVSAPQSKPEGGEHALAPFDVRISFIFPVHAADSFVNETVPIVLPAGTPYPPAASAAAQLMVPGTGAEAHAAEHAVAPSDDSICPAFPVQTAVSRVYETVPRIIPGATP